MAAKTRIEYSLEDLEKLENGINSFAESWPEKPESIKGKKPSAKVSIIKCSNAIRTLLDRGYTSDDIASGLKTIGIEMSPVTLKSYIADIVKADKAAKSGVIKKTKAPKASETPPAASAITPPATMNTESKFKKTAGAKAADENDY